MLAVARRWKLEGVIAKRPDSVYRPGVRVRDWLKIKIVTRQEFVIGGWEPRRNNDRQIGSILVGYYSPAGMGLRFAGRVGTGFSAFAHSQMAGRLERLESIHSPFTGRAGGRATRYVRPVLVAEIAFRRWPERGQLQQASFLGLRDDLRAADVVLPHRR